MKNRRKFIIGLTGNIASGKSEVGEIFKNNGFYIIEADFIGWQVLEDEKIKKKITSLFANVIKDGKIDRQKLGSIVFSSSKKLKILNSIVHPPLLSKLKKIIEDSHENYIIVIAALIFEWGIEDWFDKTILVVSDKKIKIERLMKKGFTEAESLKRINSQMDTQEAVAKSDFVIKNNGTASQLKNKTLKCLNSLKPFKN